MYYFENKEKDLELKKVMDEWLDTPFRHHCGVKRLGCDCIHFVLMVFDELGLLDIKNIKIPDYPRDWHMHNTREILFEGLKKYLNTVQIPLSDLMHTMNGDIILSHYGKASSHAGLVYGNHVYQSLTPIGVKKITIFDQKLNSRMKFILRIVD